MDKIKVLVTDDHPMVLEGMKSKGKGNLKVLPPLYVYNENNTYTDEILEIFRYRGEVVKK